MNIAINAAKSPIQSFVTRITGQNTALYRVRLQKYVTAERRRGAEYSTLSPTSRLAYRLASIAVLQLPGMFPRLEEPEPVLVVFGDVYATTVRSAEVDV